MSILLGNVVRVSLRSILRTQVYESGYTVGSDLFVGDQRWDPVCGECVICLMVPETSERVSEPGLGKREWIEHKVKSKIKTTSQYRLFFCRS